MSEKNQPLGDHVSDHGYGNLPPPPAYTPQSSSYTHSPTAPPMKSDSHNGSDAPPYEASRGYGQTQTNYYAPPQQQYNAPPGQYAPPPQQYNAPGQYTPPPQQQYGGSSQGGSSRYEKSSTGFMDGLFGKSKPKRKPLDPPPPCLSRPPQFFQRPLPFATFKVPCKGSHLDSGFPLMYPGHVFHGHDIQELEWVRFLEDLAISASLGSGEKVKSHVLPMALGAGAAGLLISKAMQRRMKSGKANQVGSLVDIWNCYYFHHRGVNVTLMHGDKILSGLQARDSTLEQDCSSSCSSDSSSSSSSSSSSDEDSLHHYPSQSQQLYSTGDRRSDKRELKKQRDRERNLRREEKRERRNQKREERRARRDQKRKEKQDRRRQRRESKKQNLPYYLVVESRLM
ncbi:unnamed protein product [Umbelopsis ramanniana]